MHTLSVAVDVNSPAAAPLAREQVWRGLMMKAENAVPFAFLLLCTGLSQDDIQLLLDRLGKSPGPYQ